MAARVRIFTVRSSGSNRSPPSTTNFTSASAPTSVATTSATSPTSRAVVGKSGMASSRSISGDVAGPSAPISSNAITWNPSPTMSTDAVVGLTRLYRAVTRMFAVLIS